ncbi:hypothetical protein GCM10022200_21210 [Microbacterium awajiense]|uniref:Uncharacterized protein n=1 Tax=Microbacterium awajiense TaxID=415214 RepID=A0ABP7AQU2_9MICO
MEWTADVSAGDWIRERIDDPWGGTIHDVVPRGFEAYARVLHPAVRSRPVGRAWPPLPYLAHEREWDAFGRSGVEIDSERIRWADAARVFGTRLHPLAQWGALVRSRGDEWNPDAWQQVQAADGWQYDAPEEGRLDAATVAALAEVLAAHTTTPDDGIVGLWEGHGGLLGFYGETPSRAFLTFEQTPETDDPRHRSFLERTVRDPFNNVFRKPTWQQGMLPDDVSQGPRLELPGRAHVLFRGGVSELARTDWALHVPWRDRIAEEHGFDPSALSPSLVWPADRAWVAVTEVDWDSTIIGGTAETVAAVCADPRLEALGLPAEARLQWDADEVNR